MSSERHVTLNRLVDRSIKASVLLVVLLTLAGVFTALGLLAAERRISERYTTLFTTTALAGNLQSMRLAAGTWVARGDAASVSGWRRATSEAQVRVASLKAGVDGDEHEAALVGNVDHRLQDVLGAAAPLFAHASIDSGADLPGAAFHDRYASLASAIDALAEYERARLSMLRFRQDLVLSVAGLALVLLVAWSVLTLRRSRFTARALLSSLHETHAAMEQGRAELEAFTRAAPLGVFHLDEHGVPTWLNAQADAWVGHRTGREAADFIRHAVGSKDIDRVLAAWRRLVDTGERFEQVFCFTTDDALDIYAHVHAVQVVTEGRVTGIVAAMQDITGARMLQEELTRSRTRLRRMTDAIPALIARLDETDTYRFVNATYRAWFGDGAPVVGSTLHEFLGPDSYHRLEPMFRRVRSGQSVRFEMRHENLHRREFVGDVVYTPDLDDDGTYRGFYVMVIDITERKRLEENVYAAKELAQVTLDSIGDAVLTTDRSGVITFLNQRAEALLEHAAQRALGRSIDEVVRLTDSRGRPGQTSLMRAISEERTVDLLQPRQLRQADGMLIDIEDVAAPIRDRAGQVVGGVLVLRDVSVAHAMAERMRQLAESDALTGLPNRIVFEERLKASLAHLRAGDELAVLYMDLDGFKAVNDEYGHAAGDELLRQLAERLLAHCDAGDTLCRLGGDEFVALLAAPVSVQEAMLRAERFVEAAARPFLWHGESLSVTLSVGIAHAPHHGSDALKLVRRADEALYVAKSAGKNQVMLASRL